MENVVNWHQNLPAELWLCVLDKLSVHDILQWLRAFFPYDYLHWRQKEATEQNARDWAASPMRSVMQYICRRVAAEQDARALLAKHVLFPRVPVRLYSRRAPQPSGMRTVVLEYAAFATYGSRKRSPLTRLDGVPKKRRLLIENEYYMNSSGPAPRTRVRASLTVCETRVEIGEHEVTLREFPLACEFLNRICPIAVITLPESVPRSEIEHWVNINNSEKMRICAARFVEMRRALGAIVYMHRAGIVDVQMWRNSCDTTERVTTVLFRARQETTEQCSPQVHQWRLPVDVKLKSLRAESRRKTCKN